AQRAPEAAAAAESPEERVERAERAPRARQPFPAAAPPTFPATVDRRTFERCPGERVREIERDERGRVVRWAREGDLGGRAARVEARYGPDGALTGITVEPADAAAPDAAALGVPARAADATLEAPPRCDATR
ncbi:MAG TPA: Fe-S oxidoreductase, partial [Anaeromyxobacteraceae bacterium]|nr:Fe-S oxidoreductase [Anaeromyxobacteraceae bacterium]